MGAFTIAPCTHDKVKIARVHRIVCLSLENDRAVDSSVEERKEE